MAPTTTNQWVISELKSFDSLKLEKDVKIPELGEHDVLLEVDAVSLNYRDLIIPKVYQNPRPRSVDGDAHTHSRGCILSQSKLL